MSGEQLERSILERKEREELKAIASAMSLEPVARLKKADLVDQILRAAGVEVAASGNGSGPAATEQAGISQNGQLHEAAGLGDGAGAKAPSAKAPRARTTRARSAKPVALDGISDGDESSGPQADLEIGRAAAAESPISESPVSESPAVASPVLGGRSGRSGRSGADGAEDSDVPAAQVVTATGIDPDSSDAGSSNGAGGMSAGLRFANDEVATGQRPSERLERNGTGNDRNPGQQQNRHPRQGGGGQGAQGGGQNQLGQVEAGNRRSRRRRGRDRLDRELPGSPQADAPFSGELVPVKGLMDLREEGYGFLRTSGYLPSAKDVYVSVSQARRFSLRRGDAVEGACRPAGPSEKYPALLRIDSINQMTPDEARERPRFEDLTPLFPDERLRLENREDPTNVTARIIDLISPIGKGQRGMIVSPSKAGKTTIMKQIAHSVELNNPGVHLMVLLVDERPEEVTDMRRSVKGEVIASTFDRPADEHTALSELTMERAKRLVEMGRDVVIILDGITRLARAYNLAQPATGRIMSGGVDSGALYPPKKFFGAARNVEEGGSLTILATALIETGSKMDEVIFEEFKGTGNMELRLDRKLAERRIYPAIDVNASSTRHEELLFDRSQLQQVWKLRRVLNALGAEGSAAAGLELLVDKIKTTWSNDEFLAEIAKAPAPSN
ncbi:MAG: transcription termination factor Rho [Acidimicrobiales bacterium]